MLRKKGSQRQYKALAMKANVEFEMQIKTNFFYCWRNVKIYPEIYLTLESPNSNMGFPDRSAGKESACNVGDPSLIPGSRRSTGEVIGYSLQYSWDSLMDQLVKNSPEMRETWVWSLDWEDPLEKGKATHNSILAWRILWSAIQSKGLQRVKHDWATFTLSFNSNIRKIVWKELKNCLGAVKV